MAKAPVVKEVRVRWHDVQGWSKITNRFRILAIAVVRNTSIVEGKRISGINFQGFGVIGDGTIKLFQFVESEPTIEKGFAVLSDTPIFSTALSVAAVKEDHQAIELLLKFGANPIHAH